MSKIAGLILVPRKEGMVTQSARHLISLNGKSVLSYAETALESDCESVTIVEGLVNEVDEVSGPVNGLSTLNLPCSSGVNILVHHVCDVLLNRRHILRLKESIDKGAPSVFTGERYRGFPAQHNGKGALEEFISLQLPAVLRWEDLVACLRWSEQIRPARLTLPELFFHCVNKCPTTVPSVQPQGRLFKNLSADQAEGLLRARNSRKLPPAPLHRLNKKRVLVLGGSGGIGQACLEYLQEIGAVCKAPSRKQVDLRTEQWFSDLDWAEAVVHAAGAYTGRAEDIFQVNFFACRRLLEAATSRKWKGNIVFVSSTAGGYGRQGIPVYSASKAALNSLIESEAERLATVGILVNAVAPGKVDTRLQSVLNPDTSRDAMLTPRYVAEYIMRALLTGEAGRIMYLRKGEE